MACKDLAKVAAIGFVAFAAAPARGQQALPAPPPDSRTARAAVTAPFRLESCQPEPCPPGFECSLWPPAASGAMTLCRSTEQFRGKTLSRTFHIYTPIRASGPVPLVMYLHGGAPNTTTAALSQPFRVRNFRTR